MAESRERPSVAGGGDRYIQEEVTGTSRRR